MGQSLLDLAKDLSIAEAIGRPLQRTLPHQGLMSTEELVEELEIYAAAARGEFIASKFGTAPTDREKERDFSFENSSPLAGVKKTHRNRE